MNITYYAMKRRRGGEKMTASQKLCWHWAPCPGNFRHADIIGTRRAEILFRRYYPLGRKAHLLYWRSHKSEFNTILSGNRK